MFRRLQLAVPVLLVAIPFTSPGVPQNGLGSLSREPREVPPDKVRLPNGKLQQDLILKEDYEKSLQDVRQLVELSQALEKDLEQSGANVLSLSGIHKTEEIEKIAKRVRSRIRR